MNWWPSGSIIRKTVRFILLDEIWDEKEIIWQYFREVKRGAQRKGCGSCSGVQEYADLKILEIIFETTAEIFVWMVFLYKKKNRMSQNQWNIFWNNFYKSYSEIMYVNKSEIFYIQNVPFWRWWEVPVTTVVSLFIKIILFNFHIF